jgi:branched-chain amino acid transport system permease protein
VLGGALFAFLDHRLTAVGSSDAVADLPNVLSGPLSQPLFILGTVFILAVYFFPGGLAGLRSRLPRLRRSVT